ncbi:ATP-dependent Clp protease ATP-binding subunit [candidate division KSB1 bacterium]|nr:ATP-dependent Clp protease ATP-binding subunit [candidate division KSB1 bacterium]
MLNQIVASEDAIREAKVKLRQLGVEPEPSTIDPPEKFEPFAEHVIKTYPLPIAQACADFNREQELGRKFVALDRLITHLIKYLAAIFIGQARRDKPPDYPLPEKLEWIAKPTLQSWTEAIRELSELYKRTPWQQKWKLADLLPACTRPLLGRQELVDAIDYLTIQLHKSGIDEPSVIDFLQLLAWYREKEWQDGAAIYPLEKIEPLILRLQPALAVLLNELGPLRDYPLVYLERADAVGSELRLRLVKFMGQFTEDVTPANKPALAVPQAEAQHIKRNRFYVAAADGIPLLGMHPFFILYRWELFALEHHGPTDAVEFRSCSRGISLSPPPEAKTFFATWLEEQTKGAPAEEAQPEPGEDENWYDKIEPIQSDDPMELLPLTCLNAEGRQALEFALGEALRIGRFWLGVEFLLMGLTRQDGQPLSDLLHEMDISRSQFRGVLRGMAGIATEDDWQRKDVAAIGAAALLALRPADPEKLATSYSAGKEQTPVATPRMMQVLRAAKALAGDEQIGHGHLLLAALRHHQCLAVNLLLGLAAQAGWDPRKVYDWVRQRAGIADRPAPNEEEKSPDEPPDMGLGQIPRPPQPHSPNVPRGKGMLGTYGRDLNAEAKAGKLHSAIGVEAKLRQMKRILLQRETNNPLLIGEAGVGKTAIVEGLAYELVHGKPNVAELQGKRIVEISINSLVAGTKYRGELEERVERVLAEVKASPEVIVFIDEIHTVLGGGGDSVSNIANALKPALARGEFRCIGATTINEYRQYIEKDPALRRRFETILVEEPSIDDCIEILKGLFNEQYGLEIPESAIEAAVHLTARYIQDERLPAKAIKLLHQAEAYVKLPSFFGHDEKAEKEQTQPLFAAINEDLIRYLLSRKTGIPLERLKGDELERIKGIEETLKSQVIGQDEAAQAVAQVIKRARAELRDPRRPVGVFLFVGPTGVGKTELARALAGFLFNDPEHGTMIRLDMSEYMEKHQVSRLIGAPPGYVGYEEEGQLTGQLRLHPYSVVLLDEIEKAHEDVHNIFLQLFDEGRLTDAKGRTVNGREAIFIMTSNVGSEIYAQDQAGFLPHEKCSPEWLQEKRVSIDKAIRVKFKPEFLNRVDRIIHFNPLTKPDLKRIFDLQFESVKQRLLDSRNVHLAITPEAGEHVCTAGYDALNGARPLARAIDRLIVEPLTDLILGEKIKANDTIMINYNGLQLTFEKSPAKGGAHE